MAPKTDKRKETLIQQIMRREVEWGSVLNFLEEKYRTDDVDALQLTYITLACLDKLLDNISDFTLTTNENTTLAKRSGERPATLLKWRKIMSGLSESKMNTFGASGDNPVAKTIMYASSLKLYQTDTRGTIKIHPKITRRYNLRNRLNFSNNSRESLSDRNLHKAISITSTGLKPDNER